MNRREIVKAAGLMLIGSVITVLLLALWFGIAFRHGFPT